MRHRSILLLVLLAPVGAACGSPGTAQGNHSAEVAADSATASALARFRTGLPKPSALEGGAASVSSLIERYMDALAAHDTAALVSMHLTDAEFAWLYYPESPYTRRPYRQDPDVVWSLLRLNSEKGIARALRLYGGVEAGFLGSTCGESPLLQGRNRLWQNCRPMVRPSSGDGAVAMRLFGSILERDGRFKFLSYTNDL